LWIPGFQILFNSITPGERFVMTYNDRTYDDRPRSNTPTNVPPQEYREEYATHSEVAVPRTVNARVDYHDLVRWGPIIAGIVITIATQLILSSLGVAIGLSAGAAGTDARTVSTGVGIWAVISLLIALFVGGWIMAGTCGPMNKKTALLNGAILWAATLAVSGWLLASGVSGTFGIAASGAGAVLDQVQEPGGLEIPENPGAAVPNSPPPQAQNYAENAARASWYFLFGSLLGLVASLIGATAGARKPRTYEGDRAR
jgi:hypothetical protein